MQLLTPDVRMMYVSRHIYLLEAALVNLTLGRYLQLQSPGWRRLLQQIGSPLILFSAVSLLLAFIAEPTLGIAGRSWRSSFGLCAIRRRDDSHCGKPCPQAELTALPVVSKIEKFEYAGVAHW